MRSKLGDPHKMSEQFFYVHLKFIPTTDRGLMEYESNERGVFLAVPHSTPEPDSIPVLFMTLIHGWC
jgi:hypothetical protein